MSATPGNATAGAGQVPTTLQLNKAQVSVTMTLGDLRITHVFKRPTLNDWKDYLGDLRPGFVQGEGDAGWSPRAEEGRASSALWDALIVSTTGYKGAESEGWKKKVPTNHKVTGVKYLQDVWVEDTTPEDKDEEGNIVFDLEADSRTVVLGASWDGFKFDRLIHVLRIPTAEQEVRFERTRVHYVRTKGDSTRIYAPPALGKMAELYDELIIRVEGYAVVKEPTAEVSPLHNLTEDVSAIKRHMDALHKQAAALAILSQQPTGEPVRADALSAEAEEIEV